MRNGRVNPEFAGDKVARICEWDSMYIPWGTPHNEISTSDARQLLEVSVPADMGTKPCEKPV